MSLHKKDQWICTTYIGDSNGESMWLKTGMSQVVKHAIIIMTYF